MIEMYYDAYAIAYYMVGNEMGSRSQLEFLDRLYAEEREFLHPYYRENRKDFIADVLYCADYLTDMEAMDLEFPKVERDFKAMGRQFLSESIKPDEANYDLYFMLKRLEILYGGKRDYIRMKLKTLLGAYGYKRRSEKIMSHIRDCLMFYHIQPYLRGEEECDIREIDLDDMITFRVL